MLIIAARKNAGKREDPLLDINLFCDTLEDGTFAFLDIKDPKMPTTFDLIEAAKYFIVSPAKDGKKHRIFASDGTFNLVVETYPASQSEDEVFVRAVQMAGKREVRVERDSDPTDLSRFFK